MKGGVRGIGTETEDAEDEDRDESFRADGVDVKIQGVVTVVRNSNNSGHVWRYLRRQSFWCGVRRAKSPRQTFSRAIEGVETCETELKLFACHLCTCTHTYVRMPLVSCMHIGSSLRVFCVCPCSRTHKGAVLQPVLMFWEGAHTLWR